MPPSSVPTHKVGLGWVFVSFRFRPMGGEGESATVDGKYDLGCDIFKTHTFQVGTHRRLRVHTLQPLLRLVHARQAFVEQGVDLLNLVNFR